MKLVFIQERQSPNGAVEQLARPLEQDTVVIGRGGASHIILPSSRIASEHVKLSWREGRLFIQDLGSFLGLRVNGDRASECYLTSGDEFLLGDEKFLVKIERDVVTLLHSGARKPAGTDEERVARDVAALKFDSYLPRMRWLSLGLLTLVMVACLASPVARSRYGSWSSGPISHAHKVFENDCGRCHSDSFKHVQDKECLSCHVMTEHAKDHARFVSDRPERASRCGECHIEHQGDQGLIQRDSRPCVSCHGGLSKLTKNPSIVDVASFEQHPEFKVTLRDAQGLVTRVSMGDSAGLVDRTPLKLNHAVHLKKGLRGVNGPVTLGCNACHQLSSERTTMLPVSFEKHCRECHSLGFDERLPDSEVPHGNEGAVYKALLAEYSRFLLREGNDRMGDDKPRIMPGDTINRDAPIVAADLARVEGEARRAEKEIFTRTGCYLCHEYKGVPLGDGMYDGARYQIVKPHVPDVWMTKARFDHSAHEAVSCESCHEKTRTSEKTSDLLLPASKVCRDCHIDGEKSGYVSSDCGQCHPYHQSLEVPHEKKQGLSEFLHHMTR